jgi:hypothetical protein
MARLVEAHDARLLVLRHELFGVLEVVGGKAGDGLARHDVPDRRRRGQLPGDDAQRQVAIGDGSDHGA